MDKAPEFSEQKINMLLNIASKKMGMSPAALRAKLEDGTFDNMVKGLSEADAKKLSGIANDPKKVDAMLSNPENAKKLSEMLGKNTNR